MKKILGAAVLAVAAVAIIKKVKGNKDQKAGSTRHLHTGAREEAYFKLERKASGKKKKQSLHKLA